MSDDGTHQSAGGHVSRLKKNVQPSLKFKYESVVKDGKDVVIETCLVLSIIL